MQYHLDGFQVGDPRFSDGASQLNAEIKDVVIVGAGPAGLTCAAYLSQFPEISTVILETKPGAMKLGQADGVSCRSMEMFQAFGIANRVMEEAYWVNDTVFWRPNEQNKQEIQRAGRIEDVEDGLSEMPHVILNQARIHDMYLDVMARSTSRLSPIYDAQVTKVTAGTPNLVHLANGDVIKARYVVGCDGARSIVRHSIGRALTGDSANKAWGVMDVLAVTDFPDIRCKAIIQSESEGTIVLIPREGGYLARFYIEMDQLRSDERVRDKELTIEDLVASANRILRPYKLDVKEVPWWSVYEIGQRLADSFQDDTGTIFIAGDACHTHSPKAGQGMNVGMGDGFNLGWKLAAVISGTAQPDLLHTYSAERQSVAQDLIDFDREWTQVLIDQENNGETPEFQKYFVEHGRYTAGVAVRFAPSILTGNSDHQALATGFEIGTRFHSAPVIRVADGKRIELGHTVLADGRWRLFAFGSQSKLSEFCHFWIDDRASPLNAHCKKTQDPDAVFDLRAILPIDYRDIDITTVPEILRPPKGRYGLTDYEKVFCPDLKTGPNIFDLRGIDRDQGALVVVRPDQYVSDVLPFSDRQRLSGFFAAIFK